MSVHQIIYTSCMRGINGVNDGQQVFSYDVQFKGWDDDDIKSLFSYQPPALGAGVIMTEEIAATLPRAFTFRKFDNGICALALGTYLGRDYMGSAGRFGNHLSHVIAADEREFINYPCEFYGSPLLRDHMEFEEVNNPNRPEYLPTPVLEKGYVVDIDAVLEFLSIDNRIEIYKNMLCAMLAFERERKRVVICDFPENIVMWIAALEYALPLKIALGISFTTYEFDPSLSASQICGVVENGTRYTNESKRMHFVFDIYQNDWIEFEKDADFYDFIDTVFSLSFDSMQDFHVFLTEGYCYAKANEEIYSAYALYSMLSDGISGIRGDRLEAALLFAQKYAVERERDRIIKILLSQRDEFFCIDRGGFLNIIKYLLSAQNTINRNGCVVIKNIIIDRILGEFLNAGTNEDDFITFYNAVDDICVQRKFSLAIELMQDTNRVKLFTAMQRDVCAWKVAFIIIIVSNYVKEKSILIGSPSFDKIIGQIYYGIIMGAYNVDVQNGFFSIECILNEFSDDCTCLVNMTLNIERMLLGLPYGEREVEKLWKYFGQRMLSLQSNNFDIAYSILKQYQKYEQVFMLWSLELQNASDVAVGRKVFHKHFHEFIRYNRSYASTYEQKVLSLYFNKLNDFAGGQVREAEQELFDLLVDEKIDTDFSDELMDELVKSLPFESPTVKNAKFIQDAFQYKYNFRGNPAKGKLFLLFIGMTVEDMNTYRKAKEKIKQLEVLAQNGKADLGELSRKSVDEYFAWVLPKACEACRKDNEMFMFYSLFCMPKWAEEQFFSYCTKLYLKQCKGKKDYEIFAEYFGFVCKHGNALSRKEVGKILCKLNKSKMAELDVAIQDVHGMDKEVASYWEEVKDIAETTNPLLNNISSFFKRKR